MIEAASVSDYLDYSPPRLVAALRHTTHKTTVPKKARIDAIELTAWSSFADDARTYADVIRNLRIAATAELMPLPEKKLTGLQSELQMYMLVERYVSQPFTIISKTVFGKVYEIGVVDGLLSLYPDTGILSALQNDPLNKIAYCAIEFKTMYAFPSVDGGNLVAAFNSERLAQQPDPDRIQTRQFSRQQETQSDPREVSLSSSDQTKVLRAVTQLWGYMTVNHLKYGIITTINDTYFFRRLEHSAGTPSQLQVSHSVSVDNGQLPFMTALLYLTSLIVQGHLYTSPYTTPTMRHKHIVLDDPYTVMNLALSEICFTHSGMVSNTVARANIGTSRSPLHVHVKFFDLSKDKDNDATEKFLLELQAYRQLQSLQGTVIPRLYGSFLASGFLYGLFLEICGEPVNDETFEANKARILGLVLQLHSLGVAHGDIARRNVLVKGDEIKLIDFDHCHLRSNQTQQKWNFWVKDDRAACQMKG